MGKTPTRDTKTGHRGEQKPFEPKHYSYTAEELQRIKDASFVEGREVGFNEGVHYIVAQVETILCKELGFNNSEELRRSGKMPAVWIAALVSAYGEDYEERQKKKMEAASGEVRPRIKGR